MPKLRNTLEKVLYRQADAGSYNMSQHGANLFA